VTIPTQQVGKDGAITMPYAGTLRVAGSSPIAVSAIIQDRLANRALEPQVVVSDVDRRAGPVSVLGEVSSATRFSLDPGGARILESIARAGGPRFPAYESMVTLQRDGTIYKALLSEIAQIARQNVQLQANDVIYVSHEPRYFIAMGAIGQGASLGPRTVALRSKTATSRWSTQWQRQAGCWMSGRTRPVSSCIAPSRAPRFWHWALLPDRISQ
jgi:polysaccharide export outer membrane protein